jgi:DNA-3-methyladenine glycosylase
MDFLQQDSVTVARQLIGYRFYVKRDNGSLVGGMIVETEAYNSRDAASHSYRGKTPRTKVMFGEAGHLYVYFTYGMHWCFNIVTGPVNSGEAVLIRALVPDEGIEVIRKNRGGRPDKELTDGPAKVCQALGITGADNGAAVRGGRFILLPPVGAPPQTKATTRIGIRYDRHRLWRFVAIEN